MKVLQFEGTAEEFEVVSILFQASPKKGGADDGQTSKSVEELTMGPVDAIRCMLKRRPVSNGQRAVYQALSHGKLEYSEFLEKAERPARKMAGVLGALGRRINNTPEINQAGLPGNTSAVLTYERDGELEYYSLTPEAKEALEAEGII